MMRPERVPLVAAALLVPVPAAADWGATRWGMTPERVIASVPGATATERKPDGGADVWDHHKLAVAPHDEAGAATEAQFFFEPATRRLAFVKFVARDPGSCAAWHGRLVAIHGEGKRDQMTAGLTLTATRWVDAASKDRLLFSTVTRSNGETQGCHYIVQQPG